jgi:DNA-binding response OmpR family regulator
MIQDAITPMKSILLIDSETDVAAGLQDRLCRFGFHVELAGSHGEARRWVGKTEFDLILIEFNLPASPISSDDEPPCPCSACGRGTALIREFRASRLMTPIIVYTVLEGELYETAALDAGADDYVIKRPGVSVFLSRLHAHIRRRERDLGIAVKSDRRTAIGRYTLDRENRILIADEKAVALTSREIKLLEQLAANPSRIVTATEVLDHVWGGDLRRSPQALTALIKRFRRKMSKNELGDPIEAIRGTGIKLANSTLRRFTER